MTTASEQRTTESKNGKPFAWGTFVAVSIMGFGVGILVGLSMSPVLGTLFAGLIAAIAAVVAALGGYQKDSSRYINPWPMAVFVGFLTLGGVLGIFVRTHNLLGTQSVANEFRQWKDLGIDEESIRQRMFSASYPETRELYPTSIEDIDDELERWRSAGITNTTMIVDRLASYLYSTETQPAQRVNSEAHKTSVIDPNRVNDGGFMNEEWDADTCEKIGDDLTYIDDARDEVDEATWKALSTISDILESIREASCPDKSAE